MGTQRIMLLCMGLEPGADGVGDYCRRLAKEINKLGPECTIIALNDREISSEMREQPSASLQVFRLPERSPISIRSSRVAGILSDWQPDWISLQFVCYGFNRKGLAFKEAFWLPPLFRGRKLQVMLHELWVGTEPRPSIKNTLLGWAQRYLVLRLLRVLDPRLLHTTNRVDQQILARYGIASEVLPLFGNIPVGAEPAGQWLADAILAGRGPDIRKDRHRLWLFGLFGSISLDWPGAEILQRLSAIARDAGRHMVVISAGRAGRYAEDLFARWRILLPDIDFVLIGPRSSQEISQFLNSVDFGLPSAPTRRLAKSSSFAAMIDHGLPVIVNSDKVTAQVYARDFGTEAVFLSGDVSLPEQLSNAVARVRLASRSAATATAFVSMLVESN
jgi:hypothetical protein